MKGAKKIVYKNRTSVPDLKFLLTKVFNCCIVLNRMVVLKDLFSSSVRADVLALLLNSPDEKFYMREIANLVRKNPSGVKRELDRLEKLGIVVSEKA
jgi:predicted transcriptional regulator